MGTIPSTTYNSVGLLRSLKPSTLIESPGSRHCPRCGTLEVRFKKEIKNENNQPIVVGGYFSICRHIGCTLYRELWNDENEKLIPSNV